jgi:serine/threonine-protein kinase
MLVGQKFGPFLIDKELGSGAMGTVYRATYEKTGQRVALKIMAPGVSSETAQARFEREGEILKQLDHPNIVRLFGVGRSHGMRYYAMEYIKGEPLDKVLQRRGKLTWEEVVALGQQLCAALQHAHEQGIIHRDIKPSNLMLLSDGTVKLTDFGIAKDLDVTQLTAANCTVGTAAYMSPEQCRGDKDMNWKSDLYSLGVVMYELLTGKKPFQADAPMEMFMKHIQSTFERPARLALDIPVWLDNLVCQLLEKKPERRPRDAAAVSEALTRITEKITAQRSAGVELVKSRAIDRPAGARLEEEDRETALALHTAVTGRKLKRKRAPIYQRGWFIAVGVVAILGTMAALLYIAFKPPPPEALFAKAERLMASSDPEDWDHAIGRDGPITEYLRRYGQLDNSQTTQVREWSKLANTALKERQLANRIKMNLSPQDDAERAAQSAVRHEGNGDLAAAKKSWEAVLKHKDDYEIDGPTWALLAEKHLQDLNAVEERLEQWRQTMLRARRDCRPCHAEDEREQAAERAIHFELFGDEQGAREAWAAFPLPGDEQTAEQRLAKLLHAWALFRVRNLSKMSKEQRLEYVQKQLSMAEGLEPLQARAVYYDILTLYGDLPDFVEVVQQARMRLGLDKR